MILPRAARARAAAVLAAAALSLASCGFFELTDPYGNQYGGWYNPGQDYRWQLAICEQAIDTDAVPNAARKHFLLCCMWRHGVPIDGSQTCGVNDG